MTDILLEACVETLDAAVAAVAGGAARLELCVDLAQGGVTPSAGLISECAARAGAPVAVLVRPRPGNFVYNDDELRMMRKDIEASKALGAKAVVFGILTADGTVDVESMRPLVDASRPMEVVFHRAFDATRDQEEALDALISLGVDRVLTSGGSATALDGAEMLRRLAARGAGRIEILAGGKIRPDNAAAVAERSGVTQMHFRAAAAGEVEAVADALSRG